MRPICILLMSIVVTITACVNIQSNTKSNAVPTFSRILVVLSIGQASDAYTQQFIRAFPANYQVCTVVLSPLSFDDPDDVVRKQADECRSEVILTINQTQRGWSDDYSSVPYEYNAEMRSVATNQTFWKAIISSNPNAVELVPPRSLVKRLLTDRVITGKLSQSESLQALN